MKVLAVSLVLLLLLPIAVHAQRPDTVFFENLTFDEIRDLIKGGSKNVIVATGGMEANGPQLVLGTYNRIVTYTAEKIARSLGNTLVAPVIGYAPVGSWTPPGGNTQTPGSLRLPDDKGFQELLEAASNSMKGSGFKNIIFIGESDGNQAGMKAVADKLNTAWKGSGVRVLYVPDYYTKTVADQRKYITTSVGLAADKIGTHANIAATSELMFVNSQSVRVGKIEAGNATNGVVGDPTKASPLLGQALLKIKIDNAVAQIKQLMAQAN